MNNKKTLLSISKTYSELLQLISAQEEVIKNQSWIHPQIVLSKTLLKFNVLNWYFSSKHNRTNQIDHFDWSILPYM